ncbi:hypothetical protein GCM10029964_009380 [Kibdelosporangium lantanae]
MFSKVRVAGVAAALTVAGFLGSATGALAAETTPRGPWETWNQCNDKIDEGLANGSFQGPVHCEGQHEAWWIVDGPDPV